MSLAYLGGPYSHPDPEVIEQRIKVFCQVFAYLVEKGEFPVSPLMNHLAVKCTDMPGTWDYWKKYAEALMQKCIAFYVIKIDGWDSSSGLKGEIALAAECSLPIFYVEVDLDAKGNVVNLEIRR